MVQHTQVLVTVSLLLVRLHDLAGRQFVWGLQVVAEVAAPRNNNKQENLFSMSQQFFCLC